MTTSDDHEQRLRELVIQIREARSRPSHLKSLLEEYERDWGPEANEEVLRIIAQDTVQAWSEIAMERESNTIEDLLDTLWVSFKRAGGEFTIQKPDDGVQIHCTKCPMVDTYKKIGKPEFGLLFHCSTDPHIVEGFNKKIRFDITKRLMSGDDCCDHRYTMTVGSESDQIKE